MKRITKDELLSRLAAGESQRAIARSLGCSYQNLQEYRRRWNLPLMRKAHTPANPATRYVDGRFGYVYVPNPRGRRGGKVVAEHVLIAEKALGRTLRPGEVCHHINGIKTDNRLENILVLTQAKHRALHFQLERLALELFGRGFVEFDGKQYHLASIDSYH